MTLSRLKFNNLTDEEVVAELQCSAFADGQLDGDTSNDTIDYRTELESRLFEKNKKILELNRKLNENLWRLHQ